MYAKLQQLKLNPETENIGKKWAEEEINELLNEIKDDTSFESIALLHKRTIGSIRGKLLNIADHYIHDKKMDINEVSKIVRLSVMDINAYLLKKLPKKEVKITNSDYLNGTLTEVFTPKPVIKLNTEQQNALDAFMKGDNIFLTGPAGTGKSVTLNKILEFCNSKNIKSDQYELIRYGSIANVVGGSSKLLKYFIKTYNPSKIMSYADRRWVFKQKNMYSDNNFELVSITTPNYWYIDKKKYLKRYHRFNFRKSELIKKLKFFDNTLSEWENMQLNGYDRIWDCGNLKYELNF